MMKHEFTLLLLILWIIYTLGFASIVYCSEQNIIIYLILTLGEGIMISFTMFGYCMDNIIKLNKRVFHEQ